MLHRGHKSPATKPTDCIKLCGQATAAEYRSVIISKCDSENLLLPLDLIKLHTESERANLYNMKRNYSTQFSHMRLYAPREQAELS